MTIKPLAAVCLLSLSTPGLSAGEPAVFDIWPAAVPGEKGDVGEEKVLPPRESERPVIRLTNVTKPTIKVFHAPKETNTGAAVVICPGGGFYILAWDKEGEEVAKWLNSIGVTGIVLKYRVPWRKDRPKRQAPLQDAQRAMSLVRSKAKAWNINPSRIGILGFSAGGELSAVAATHYAQRAYDEFDEVDKVNCRPDFAVLVYPAGLLNETNDGLDPAIRVDNKTPPMFFAHAGDDRVSPLNSVHLFAALKKANVPAEIHIYATGGHGFGLRPSNEPCSTWPKSCEKWLRGRGLLKTQ